MKKRRMRKKKGGLSLVDSMLGAMGAKNDPQGSYTGRPREAGEKPVQDADDL